MQIAGHWASVLGEQAAPEGGSQDIFFQQTFCFKEEWCDTMKFVLEAMQQYFLPRASEDDQFVYGKIQNLAVRQVYIATLRIMLVNSEESVWFVQLLLDG